MKKFQNIEFYETDKFQYLLIQKNGSSSVRECIKHLNPTITDKANFNKVRWTVIREPYFRFVAGLNYDLKRHGLELEEVGYDSLHNSRINNFSMNYGDVNHSASQIPYLMNTHIDWYVELKDLGTFLKMHFDKVEYVNMDKDKEKIDFHLDPMEVHKFLDLDYYIYNQILTSDHLWKWQNGKIF
tara:strand:+ start:64 stop:615 length:552 start_codon:yes stop_codon:yes gene_type:complete